MPAGAARAAAGSLGQREGGGCPAAATSAAAAAGLAPVLAGQGRVTGPVALITWWKATGGLVFEHVPPERAPMARMLSW